MSSEQPTNPQDPKKEEHKSIKDKFNETWSELKNQKFDGFRQYINSNTRDTIAYIVLILGLILLFFYSFWGGLLIGLVAGMYFSDEIHYFIKNANGIIEKQGMVRSIIFGVTLLALFILAPSIFVGAIIAVAIKLLAQQ